MTWIKSHWKLLSAIIIGLLIALWILSATGMSGELYNMMLNQFKTDESRIIKEKDQFIKDCENEIAKLANEKEKLKNEKIAIQKQVGESSKEVLRLKGKVNELQKRIDNIIVSNDPDVLISDLNRMGYGPIRRH